MGAYQQVSELLIERGYGAVPIMPGTKAPGFFFAGMWIGLANWQKRFNNGPPPADERARWAAGDSGVGVLGGKGSHGLVGVDIDTDDFAIRAALGTILPTTLVRKIGNRGETMFYYGADVPEFKSWYINGKCIVELIGPGRQAVLPPTIHPETGAPYYWSGSARLEDLAPHELPALPGDIAGKITAVLIPFGYCPESAPHENSDDESPHRQLNNAALANLDAWVPALALYRCRPARGGYEAVPIWRPSTTRPTEAPEERHLNLKIVPKGIRDFGADKGYTPLDLVMVACECDLDTAFRFLSERLNWAPDIDLSGLLQLKQPELQAPEPDRQVVEPEQPQAAEPRSKSKPAVSIDELERFTVVPGAVGDIVDWIVATSRRPSRIIALGAAITIVGSLIGRRVAGPTRSATNLYVVGVAPTGYGKQRALDSVPDLLEAAGAIDHFGSAKFFSLSAVLELMQEKPLVLCVQDEIGALLQSITNRKASNHEKAVSQILADAVGLFVLALASCPLGHAQDAAP